MSLIAQLKCIYTNALSMNNTYEELETMVRQENHCLVVLKTKLKRGGIVLVTGLLQWRAISSLGETDNGEETVEWLSMLSVFVIMWSLVLGMTNLSCYV